MVTSRFDLVPKASSVAIEAHSSLHPIRAETRSVRGHLDADVAHRLRLVGGELILELATLRSGNPLIDRETRRRLDLRHHPTIVATLLRSTATKVPSRHDCDGEVAFHGHTQVVTGHLDVEEVDDELVVEGEQTFDVRRWGVEAPRLLTLKVDPHVRVRMRLVARRDAGVG